MYTDRKHSHHDKEFTCGGPDRGRLSVPLRNSLNARCGRVITVELWVKQCRLRLTRGASPAVETRTLADTVYRTLYPYPRVTNCETSDSFGYPPSNFDTHSLGRPVLANTLANLLVSTYPYRETYLKTNVVFGA
jgi:hypothetical protein